MTGSLISPRRTFRNISLSGLLQLAIVAFMGATGSAQTGAPVPLASFGSVNVGSTGLPQPVSFTLPDAASISSISVVPAVGGRTEYTVGALSGCVADGATINALNTVCIVSIAFKPGYPGTHQTPLKVVTSTGIRYYGLLGTGVGPAMSFSPANSYPLAGCNPSTTTCPGTEGSLATTYALPTTQDFAVDNAGNVYILQFGSFQALVRRVDGVTGNITSVTGGANGMYGGPGHLATQTQFYDPSAIAVDGQGNFYIADYTGYNGVDLIYKIDIGTGLVSNYAGQGTNAVLPTLPIVNVPFTQAVFTGVGAMIFDPAGNMYISQPGGIVELNATTGLATFIAGGPGANAIKDTTGLAVDAAGNVFFADLTHEVVRRVDAVTRQITIVAGVADSTGQPSVTYNGPATGAIINPTSIALDAAGNLYIDSESQQASLIYRVDAATQNMTLAAGYTYGGIQTFSYPNYPTLSDTNAYASVPRIDAAGNIYFLTGNGNLSLISKTDGTQAQLRFPFVPHGTSVTNGEPYPNSTYETVALTNIGNAPLVVSAGSPAVTGAAFALDDPTTTGCASPTSSPAGFTLAPGTSCSLATDFTPTIGGVNLGSLTITDNAVNSVGNTQTVALFGVSSSNGLTITPASLTFANTAIGTTSATLTAVVSNNSASNVLLTGGSRTNSDSADFTETDSCGTKNASGSLFAAGTTCTLSFTFNPQSAGALTGSFTLTDSFTSANTVTLSLNGTGTGGSTLSITPATQTFPSTAVGSVSLVQTSTLTNSSSNAIYLSTGTLTDSADFQTFNNCNGLLAANSTCVVSFNFRPQTSGPLTSTFSINDLNAPGSPVTVVLSGPGTAPLTPNPVFTPNTISFGTVLSGTTSAAITATLSNTGTGTLNISSVTIIGAGFNQTNACGTTLAAGASCTISVTCSPTTTGSLSANLFVNFPSPIPQQTAALSCTGNTPTSPQAVLTPQSLTFNSTTGTASAVQTLTLTNPGTAALPITSIALSGANPAQFSETTTCGTSLAAGATCAISVTFNAATAGTYTAPIVVSDSLGTQSSLLTGTATNPTTASDFAVAATPATQSTYRGATATYALLIAPLSPSNPFTSTVTLTATGLPAGATATFAPATVTPGTAGAPSTLSITVPALTSSLARPATPWRSETVVASCATLLFCFCFKRRRVLPARLLGLLLLVGLGSTMALLSGCGTGTGFATPVSTSTITITATSGTTVHTTTVTLTVK